jgi:hypothetical protein
MMLLLELIHNMSSLKITPRNKHGIVVVPNEPYERANELFDWNQLMSLTNVGCPNWEQLSSLDRLQAQLDVQWLTCDPANKANYQLA